MEDIENIVKKVKALNLKDWDDLYTFLSLRDEYFYKKKIIPIEVFDNIYLDHELNTSLKDILGDNLELKLKASKYLESAPRKATDNRLKAWLKDPRTNTILYKALDDDNMEVFQNSALCLSNIFMRYKYDNSMAFDKIVSKFEDADDSSKIMIAQACGSYPNDKRWEYINKAFDCKPLKKAIEMLRATMYMNGKEAPLKDKKTIKNKMLKIFHDTKNKNEIVKAKALDIAILLMQKEDLDELKAIKLNFNLLSSSEYDIEEKIKELEK